MSGPVTDPRAHVLRDRFHRAYTAPELPVSVELIADDLLGLVSAERRGDASAVYKLGLATNSLSHFGG